MCSGDLYAEGGMTNGTDEAGGTDPKEWGEFWHNWANGFVSKSMQRIWLDKFRCVSWA